MFSCPFCNRELTEKRLRSGRCPYCQGDVKRDAPAGAAARSTHRTAHGSPPRLSDTAVPPADFYEEEDTDSASRLAPMATLPMLGKTTRADDRDAASAEGGQSAADGNAAFRSETMQGSALNQLRSADAFSATFV